MVMKPDLPPLPTTFAHAVRLAANPDADVDELTSVVEVDPVLTLAVLRFANSAFSAPAARIDTARRAVVRLGSQQVRRIVLGSVVGKSFTALGRAHLDGDELWRHLVACGLLADAAAWGDVAHSVAFTAGLLHDLGRLALAQQTPGEYLHVVERAQLGEDVLQVERDLFGVDHCEFGASVAAAWDVPGDLVEAIADHHTGGGSALARVVYTGREAATALGIGDGIRPAAEEPAEITPEIAKLLDAFGGQAKFFAMIGAYAGALSG